jgi:hypothetical protein
MYSALMLSMVVQERYAARLADAEHRRQLRELSGPGLRLNWHLPRIAGHRRTRPAACSVAR